VPGIVIVRLDAPLFFANTVHFEQAISDHLAEGQDIARDAGLVSGVRFLVLDLSPVTRSDSSGAHMLLDLAKDLKEQGVQLVLANPTDQVRLRFCPMLCPMLCPVLFWYPSAACICCYYCVRSLCKLHETAMYMCLLIACLQQVSKTAPPMYAVCVCIGSMHTHTLPLTTFHVIACCS
jgi:anti-anti-sigma regulatory factor